jgi:hypothetical protein
MKDFKEAASRMAGEFYASDDMSHNVLCEKCMEHGYSEAMKEQREVIEELKAQLSEANAECRDQKARAIGLQEDLFTLQFRYKDDLSFMADHPED